MKNFILSLQGAMKIKYMVLHGHLWSSTVPYGTVWPCMVPFGPIWSCMVPQGLAWSLMVPFGPIRLPMVWFDPIWSCMVWSLLVQYGPVWYCMVPQSWEFFFFLILMKAVWVRKLMNTSLAAPGALAHRLQYCTACNTSPPTNSKMADRVWK